jgi:hypothetical protein
VTVATRSPRLTVPVVTVPVTAQPVTSSDPVVDALVLAVEIRAFAAAAFRVHDLAPRG